MPVEVADQVHRHACRAKAKHTITFTNVNNEDLDDIHANIDRDDEDINLIKSDAKVMNGKDDHGDSEYHPSEDESQEDDDDDYDDRTMMTNKVTTKEWQQQKTQEWQKAMTMMISTPMRQAMNMTITITHGHLQE